MIYRELQNLLALLTDPDEVLVFDSAVEMLERYEASNHMDVFATVVNTVGTEDTTALMDALRSNLRLVLEYMLQIQGVKYHPDVQMSSLVKTLDALQQLQEHEDRPAVLAMLDSEDSINERFATLVNFCSSLGVDEILSFIEEVDSSFGANLRDYVQQEQPEEEVEFKDVEKYVGAYRKFRSSISEEVFFTDVFFQGAATIGMPLERYLAAYTQYGQPEKSSMTQICQVLFACALISADGNGEPVVALAPYLTQLFSELLQQTQARAELLNINQAYASLA